MSPHERNICNKITASKPDPVDYIVVGAGLAGTVVAARLTENTSLTVLLIEAGQDERSNPLIYDIYRYDEAFTNRNLTWYWPTDQSKGLIG